MAPIKDEPCFQLTLHVTLLGINFDVVVIQAGRWTVFPAELPSRLVTPANKKVHFIRITQKYIIHMQYGKNALKGFSAVSPIIINKFKESIYKFITRLENVISNSSKRN